MGKTIKGFIAEECANFFSSDPAYRAMPWCESKQSKCAVYTGTRCAYFERSVLPADPDMAGAYAILCAEAPEQHVSGLAPKPEHAPRRATVPRKPRSRTKQVSAHVAVGMQTVLGI